IVTGMIRLLEIIVIMQHLPAFLRREDTHEYAGLGRMRRASVQVRSLDNRLGHGMGADRFRAESAPEDQPAVLRQKFRGITPGPVGQAERVKFYGGTTELPHVVAYRTAFRSAPDQGMFKALT